MNCACATNDEFWVIMILRFGSICANDIVSICTVVPVTCGPWRAEIAKELLGLLTPSQSEGIDTALSASLKLTLVDPRASYESVFSRVLNAGVQHRSSSMQKGSVFSVRRVVAYYLCQTDSSRSKKD